MRWHRMSCPALTIPFTTLITPSLGMLVLRPRFVAFTPLLVNGFPNELAPNVPNCKLRNLPFFFYFIFNCFVNTINE